MEFIIPIRKGARDGEVVVLREVGRAGTNGGPNGDLHVKLRMKMHDPETLNDEQWRVLKRE